MLVRNKDMLSTLERARAEVSDHRAAPPARDFYDAKLARAWDRARRSAAYSKLEAYSPTAFNLLPVTPKEALKKNPWDYVAVGIDDTAKYYETTGTSGAVTPTPRTVEDVVWNAVAVAEAWGDLIANGDRVLVLLPSDLVPVADLVVSVCEYRGVPHARAYPFATGITDWDRLIGVFRAFKPTILVVAPGVAVQFTRLAKQRGLLTELARAVRSVMLLGEVSTAPARARLGAWWGARCYDASYGSTETGTLAATCSDGTQHLLTATNYFELHTAAGVEPLGPGDTPRRGSLLVTPLNLYARPLLRLDTADEVTVGVGCACGSGQPTVTVHGRTQDQLTVRDAVLTPRAVEEIVYSVTTATGYLIEADTSGSYARLLLERDVDTDRTTEAAQSAAVQAVTDERLGARWDDVVFVNSLSVMTKSGGSQKSWKRSNVRIVEPVG